MLPGAADARATKLNADEPLSGLVGVEGGTTSGCRLLLQTRDQMGNLCVRGGADVKLQAWRGTSLQPSPDDLEAVHKSVHDNDDGSFRLEWKSKYSGTFTTRILVNNTDVLGSPRQFSLISSRPELSKTTLEGGGLEKAVAGEPATIRIAFVDMYDNTALPGVEFKFGIAFLKDKERVQNAEPAEFEGAWEPGDTGVYQLTYTVVQVTMTTHQTNPHPLPAQSSLVQSHPAREPSFEPTGSLRPSAKRQ